jgi:hypothetical protein
MPITLTLTQGAIPDAAVPQAVQGITDAFLVAHSLSGNKVMTPNVTTHVHMMAKGSSYAGGKPVDAAWIEAKVPSFALADRDVQQRFFSEATQILHDLSGGSLSKDRIWSNCVHAVDGTWNLDGAPLTNAELGAALAKG